MHFTSPPPTMSRSQEKFTGRLRDTVLAIGPSRTGTLPSGLCIPPPRIPPKRVTTPERSTPRSPSAFEARRALRLEDAQHSTSPYPIMKQSLLNPRPHPPPSPIPSWALSKTSSSNEALAKITVPMPWYETLIGSSTSISASQADWDTKAAQTFVLLKIQRPGSSCTSSSLKNDDDNDDVMLNMKAHIIYST